MAEELGVEVDHFAETALRFVLSQQAVSTVIPGMRSVRNVERNMSVGDGKGLPAEQLPNWLCIVGSAASMARNR